MPTAHQRRDGAPRSLDSTMDMPTTISRLRVSEHGNQRRIPRITRYRRQTPRTPLPFAIGTAAGAESPSVMMTIERRVGRLGEVRWRSPINAAEVTTFLGLVPGVIRGAQRTMVFCSDLRDTHALQPELADALIAMLRKDNPMIERHGVLVGEIAVFGLQIERMLREAGSASRRTFRSLNDLLAWVDPLLDAGERARARAFYAEGDAIRQARP
jgi:hypothetical protein